MSAVVDPAGWAAARLVEAIADLEDATDPAPAVAAVVADVD